MASEPLFRGMDAAEIDRQYNFRKLVPEHVDIFARWEAQSAAVRGRLRGAFDVSVGPHPRQKVDVFPAGDRAPLLVFIHGGYWRGLSKDMFSFVAEPFVAKGVAVALIGYGLCPDVTLDTLVGHARTGLAWVAEHAKEFGADSDRLVVAGHSAGGHLTATLASAEPELVKGAFALSGIYDLEPLLHFEVNEQLRLDAESARRLSPIHAVKAPAPTMVLALVRRRPTGCTASKGIKAAPGPPRATPHRKWSSRRPTTLRWWAASPTRKGGCSKRPWT